MLLEIESRQKTRSSTPDSNLSTIDYFTGSVYDGTGECEPDFSLVYDSIYGQCEFGRNEASTQNKDSINVANYMNPSDYVHTAKTVEDVNKELDNILENLKSAETSKSVSKALEKVSDFSYNVKKTETYMQQKGNKKRRFVMHLNYTNCRCRFLVLFPRRFF